MDSLLWHTPLAQVATTQGGSGILGMLIWVVIIGACCGVVYVALQQFGVKIPPFFTTVIWIILVAVVAVFAIRVIAGM